MFRKYLLVPVVFAALLIGFAAPAHTAQATSINLSNGEIVDVPAGYKVVVLKKFSGSLVIVKGTTEIALKDLAQAGEYVPPVVVTPEPAELNCDGFVKNGDNGWLKDGAPSFGPDNGCDLSQYDTPTDPEPEYDWYDFDSDGVVDSGLAVGCTYDPYNYTVSIAACY